MAAIKNIRGLTIDQIDQELQKGAKFIIFQYTVSIIFITVKQGSDIYFVRADEAASRYSWKYSLLTFFVGWWGFPFGPIYSISSLYKNFNGGKNVTQEVLNHFNTQGMSGEIETQVKA